MKQNELRKAIADGIIALSSSMSGSENSSECLPCIQSAI